MEKFGNLKKKSYICSRKNTTKIKKIMRHYTKREVNVTYTQVSDNVDVRTYPCLKFSYWPQLESKLNREQKDTLRFRRILLDIYKDTTKEDRKSYGFKVITKKGQWGSDILENIVKDVMKKEGEFELTDEEKTKKMLLDISTKVHSYNVTMLTPTTKVVRDPKTGRFIKATA